MVFLTIITEDAEYLLLEPEWPDIPEDYIAPLAKSPRKVRGQGAGALLRMAF